MQTLADKLITLSRVNRSPSAQDAAVFGRAASLSKSLDVGPGFRIGMWPCIDDQHPEATAGLMALIGLMLERWRDVRVYRLLVKLEGEPQYFSIDAAKMQFSIDDWSPDDLDENVAISGELERDSSGVTLSIELENDLSTDEENTILSYKGKSVVDLYRTLSTITSDIANEIGLEGSPDTILTADDISEVNLNVFLTRLGVWQARLLVNLWGQPWPEDQILNTHRALVEAAVALDGDELSDWAVAAITAHSVLPGYGETASALLDSRELLADELAESGRAMAVLGVLHFRSGEPQAAYDLLEDTVARIPDSTPAWLTLGEIYRGGNRFEEALDTFQRAIESEATSAHLYARYADLLLAMDFDGWDVDSFVLVDPEKDADEDSLVLWEAIEAFDESLTLKPDNPDIVQQQLLRLIDAEAVDDRRLWLRFEELVKQDVDGERVRTALDAMEILDDVETAVTMLSRHASERKGDLRLQMNLAVAHLIAGNEDASKSTLENLRSVTDEHDLLAEIDRLELEIDDPEFDAKVNEFAQIIDAGRPLRHVDVDYLEDILDRVPTLAEIWVMVARAYLAWKDTESALETLLDGYQHVPHDASLNAILSDVLWASGEEETAIQYLQKAIERHPQNVPLLARAGEYSFLVGQQVEAREYLTRAEILSPRHPRLAQARAAVARAMSGQDS